MARARKTLTLPQCAFVLKVSPKRALTLLRAAEQANPRARGKLLQRDGRAFVVDVALMKRYLSGDIEKAEDVRLAHLGKAIARLEQHRVKIEAWFRKRGK